MSDIKNVFLGALPEGPFPLVALSMLTEAVYANKHEYTKSVLRVLIDEELDEIVDEFAEEACLSWSDYQEAEIALAEFAAAELQRLQYIMGNRKLKIGFRVAHTLAELMTLRGKADQFLWEEITLPDPLDPKQLPPPSGEIG